MRIALMLLMALPVAAACDRDAAARPPETETASPRDVVPESGLAAFFDQAPVEVGRTRAELMSRLGVPDSVLAEAVSNRHDPSVTDSVFTLHFSGLAARIHRAGYDGKEILAGLEIADERFLSPASPVRLGAGEADVRAALGEPDSASAGLLRYNCEECLVAGHEAVAFVLEQGAVRRIDLRYWVD